MMKKWKQVAQEGDRCPIPGNFWGQTGQGSEPPVWVEEASAQCRGVGLETFKSPFQPKSFYDST